MTGSRKEIRQNIESDSKEQRKETNDSLSLAKLPNDILTLICDFIIPYYIFNSFNQTCKSLYNLTHTAEFIQHQYIRHFEISPPDELSKDLCFYYKFLSMIWYPISQNRIRLIAAIITEDLQAFKALARHKSSQTSSREYTKLKHNISLLNVFLDLFHVTRVQGGSHEFFYSFLVKTKRTICLNYFFEHMLHFPRSRIFSPFIIAARFGRLDIVKKMLEKDITLLDTTDSNNCTALMWASHHDYVNIVQFLLTKNPDLRIRTNNPSYLIWNQDALDLAITGRATHVIPLLLKEYANKLPNEDHAIVNPLSYAVKKEWPEIVESLLTYYKQLSMNTFNLFEIALERKDESTFNVLKKYFSNEEKEIVYQNFIEHQSLIQRSINYKLESNNASQQNFIFIAASQYELKQLKSSFDTLSNNEHPIFNTMNMLMAITETHNKLCNFPRTKDISKFFYSLIKSTVINIFGHSKYAHSQGSDKKLILAIPSCYYQLWEEVENHILSNKKHLQICM